MNTLYIWKMVILTLYKQNKDHNQQNDADDKENQRNDAVNTEFPVNILRWIWRKTCICRYMDRQMTEVKRCAIATFITWIRQQLFRVRLAVCVLAEIAQFYVHVSANTKPIVAQFDEGRGIICRFLYSSAHLTASRT